MKKIIAVLLTMAMLIGICSVSAFATETEYSDKLTAQLVEFIKSGSQDVVPVAIYLDKTMREIETEAENYVDENYPGTTGWERALLINKARIRIYREYNRQFTQDNSALIENVRGVSGAACYIVADVKAENLNDLANSEKVIGVDLFAPKNFAEDTANNTYEDKFVQWVIDNNDALNISRCYSYKELYHHKNGEDTDWVLVDGMLPDVGQAIEYESFTIGDRTIKYYYCSPFVVGYAVYDVETNDYISLNKVTEEYSHYSEVLSALAELGIGEEPAEEYQYEDEFVNWSKSKFGEECLSMGYKYDELYTHYDNGQIDWVLVEACYSSLPEPAEPTWFHVGGTGGRTVFGPSIGNCFMTGYGVYDVNDNEFYGFEQFADNDCYFFTTEFDKLPFDASKYDGLIDALAELNIGYVTGDANGDNKVDILDATLVQKAASGKAKIDFYKGSNIADVNNDYTLDILDATAIQKYAAA